MDRLENWFVPVDKLFKQLKQHTLDYYDRQKRRVFIDRQSAVLFVAHVDTVCFPRYFDKRNGCVYASGFDDRLGCWIAYTLSKELNADLLLCDNEERVRSTAEYHNCKNYNWIAEFDRVGTDVVTYGLDSWEFKEALSDYFEIGEGSLSDISFLQTSACCVNIGIGHEDFHSKHSRLDLSVVYRQIQRFKQFYKTYKNTAFVRSNYDYCELCCARPGRQIYTHVVCEDCLNELIATYGYPLIETW